MVARENGKKIIERGRHRQSQQRHESLSAGRPADETFQLFDGTRGQSKYSRSVSEHEKHPRIVAFPDTESRTHRKSVVGPRARGFHFAKRVQQLEVRHRVVCANAENGKG